MFGEKVEMAKAALKEQPKHMEFAEQVVKELLLFNPDQQNEIVMFWRNVSIDERKRKIERMKEEIERMAKEAEYLSKSCEGLN